MSAYAAAFAMTIAVEAAVYSFALRAIAGTTLVAGACFAVSANLASHPLAAGILAPTGRTEVAAVEIGVAALETVLLWAWLRRRVSPIGIVVAVAAANALSLLAGLAL